MFIEKLFALSLRTVCRHKCQFAAKYGQGLAWRDTLRKNVLTTQLLVAMCVDEVMLFPTDERATRRRTGTKRQAEALKQDTHEYDSILAAERR